MPAEPASSTAPATRSHPRRRTAVLSTRCLPTAITPLPVTGTRRPPSVGSTASCLGRQSALLVGKEARGDRADSLGVADSVDLGDLAVDDREAHHGEGPSAYGDDHPGGTVHQCR